MKKIVFFFTLLTFHSVYSSECGKIGIDVKDITNIEQVKTIPYSVIYYYAQVSPKQDDILADYSLFVRAILTPKKILWTLLNNQKKLSDLRKKISLGTDCALELFGENPDPERHTLVEIPYMPNDKDMRTIQNLNVSNEKKEELIQKLQLGQLYLEGHKNPIKVDHFVKMINQIIKDEHERNGIEPSLGNPHTWNKEFKNHFGHKYSPFLKTSKLLVALSRGETSRYMLTGHEQNLRSWMLTQELKSIVPHDLIRESYRLNNGDIYLTLLTIENTLSSNWLNPNREKLDTTIRLKPFINSFGNDGDVYGSWYHAFGIMLYGYVKGSFAARIIGNTESVGSHILSKFEDEKQEDYVNDQAALIGGRLKRSLLKKEYLTLPKDETVFDINYYFNSNENFEKRLEKI